jgi:hypothetical protein
MDGKELMEKILAVENRPVLLAGIALGGIAAAIFMKRLSPMRVLGIAPRANPRSRGIESQTEGPAPQHMDAAAGPCVLGRIGAVPNADAPPSPAVVFEVREFSPPLQRRGAEPAGTAQRIQMSPAHARRSTAPALARQTRVGRCRARHTAGIDTHARYASAESWPCSSHHVVCVCVRVCVCAFSVWCMSLAGMGTRSGCGAQRTAGLGALPCTKARAPSMSTSRSVCTCEHRVGPGVGHRMRRRVTLL